MNIEPFEVLIEETQTYTIPRFCSYIKITCQGGGGGGGGGCYNLCSGGGGGSGYLNEKTIKIFYRDYGLDLNCVIGKGGKGGKHNTWEKGFDGEDGEDTIVYLRNNPICVAQGGKGGKGSHVNEQCEKECIYHGGDGGDGQWGGGGGSYWIRHNWKCVGGKGGNGSSPENNGNNGAQYTGGDSFHIKNPPMIEKTLPGGCGGGIKGGCGGSCEETCGKDATGEGSGGGGGSGRYNCDSKDLSGGSGYKGWVKLSFS